MNTGTLSLSTRSMKVYIPITREGANARRGGRDWLAMLLLNASVLCLEKKGGI